MITIGRLEVSNALGNMIKENMSVNPKKPYSFLIDNKGLTWGMHYQTGNKISSLTKWSDKLKAEIKVIGMIGSQIEVEISDPLAMNLEMYL